MVHRCAGGGKTAGQESALRTPHYNFSSSPPKLLAINNKESPIVKKSAGLQAETACPWVGNDEGEESSSNHLLTQCAVLCLGGVSHTVPSTTQTGLAPTLPATAPAASPQQPGAHSESPRALELTPE